ncbi:MAG: energy transducer TonB [Steroidobacteraceae bacterium]|nr:energy transducer TonB [Steroidobacteraceae bacterium]
MASAPDGVTAIQPAADLTALTRSDDFLLQLGPAIGGLAAVRPVESLDTAFEPRPGRRRAQLLAIDESGPEEARQAVALAAAHAPQTLVLVFAPQETLPRMSAALRDTPVFAVLGTPIDVAAAHAVLERAVAAAAAMISPAPPATPGHAPPTPPATGQRRLRPLTLALAVLAALAALAAGVHWIQGGAHPPSAGAVTQKPAATSPSIDLSIVQGRVEDLLEKARAAMRARHFTDPPAQSALLFYRSAAAADPTNAEAQDGLRRIADVIVQRFQSALAGGHLNAAALQLANFAALSPRSPQLTDFRQQLLAAQAALQRADLARSQAAANAQRLAALAAAQRAALARAQADERAKAAAHAADANAARLLKLARARIDAGRLTEPPRDNAAYYLAEIRTADPGYAPQTKVRQALAGRLLVRARSARLAGKPDPGDLSLAQSLGADAKAVLAIRSLKATAPAAGGAGNAGAALSTRLRLVHNARPVYPRGALEDGIGGRVIVGFTVDPDGRTGSLHILKATPPGVFDRSALDAVAQWRYAPVRVGGKAVTVPAHILIRFVPPH